MKSEYKVAKKRKIDSKTYVFEIADNPDAFKEKTRWNSVRVFEKKGKGYPYVTPDAWKENDNAMKAVSNGRKVRFFTKRENGLYVSVENDDHILMDGYVLKKSKSLLLESGSFYRSIWIGMDGYAPNVTYGVIVENSALIKKNGVCDVISLPREERVTGYPLFFLDSKNENVELIVLPYISRKNPSVDEIFADESKRVDKLKDLDEKIEITVLDGNGKEITPDGFFPKQVFFLSKERIVIRGKGDRFFELNRIDREWKPATGEIACRERVEDLEARVVSRIYPLPDGDILLEYKKSDGDVDVIGILDFKRGKVNLIRSNGESFTFLFSNPVRRKVFLARTEGNEIHVYRDGSFRPIGKFDDYILICEGEWKPIRLSEFDDVKSFSKHVLIEKRGDKYYFYGGDEIKNFRDKNFFVIKTDEDRFPRSDFSIGLNGIMFFEERGVFVPIEIEWFGRAREERVEHVSPYRIASRNGALYIEKIADETISAEWVYISAHFKDSEWSDMIEWVNLRFQNGKRFTLYYGRRKNVSKRDISIIKADNGYMVYSKEYVVNGYGNEYWTINLVELENDEFIRVHERYVDAVEVKLTNHETDDPDSANHLCLFPHVFVPNTDISDEGRYKTVTVVPNILLGKLDKHVFHTPDLKTLLEKAQSDRPEMKALPTYAPLWIGMMMNANDPLYAIGYLLHEKEKLFYPVVYSRTTGAVVIDIPAPEKHEIANDSEGTPYVTTNSLYDAIVAKEEDYLRYLKAFIASKKKERDPSVSFNPAGTGDIDGPKR